MTTYNNTTNPLPEMLAGLSPFQVNTLIELGFTPDETSTLLRYADEINDHPDWSEASTDEITLHFVRLEADYILNGLGVKHS